MTLKDLARIACEDPTGEKVKTLYENLKYGHGPRFQGNRVIWKHKDVISLLVRNSNLSENEIEDLLM